jgi:hypothetical protein
MSVVRGRADVALGDQNDANDPKQSNQRCRSCIARRRGRCKKVDGVGRRQTGERHHRYLLKAPRNEID